VNQSLLLVPSEQLPLPGINFANFSPEQINYLANFHRREYFADIFAASYVGKAYREFLDAFARNNPVSTTHPATNDRLNLINNFLYGTQNNILDLFQKSLTQLSLRQLNINYSVPDVSAAFDNARPYTIRNEAELHGIYEAGSTYLLQAQTNPKNLWTKIEETTKERIINDLVEKSIRNSMIVDHWEAR